MIVNAPSNNKYHIIIDSIENVIRYVKQNFDKLKSSFKPKNKYEYLENVNENLKQISKILWEDEEFFIEELKCFSQVEYYIVYIISNNCENQKFGHIECAIYLLDIFKRLIHAKFNYIQDRTGYEEYEKQLIQYPEDLYQFRQYFNKNIFIKDHQFDEEIEKLNKILRDL